MEVPEGNFFEISINTLKLSSFMTDMFTLINKQEQKVEDMNKHLLTLFNSLNSKIKNNESQLGVEVEKIKLKTQEDLNYIKLYMKDSDKKCMEKISDAEANIDIINKKINRVKQGLEDDISLKMSFLENKINNLATTQEIQHKIAKELKIYQQKIQETMHLINTKIDQLQNYRPTQTILIKNPLNKVLEVQEKNQRNQSRNNLENNSIRMRKNTETDEEIEPLVEIASKIQFLQSKLNLPLNEFSKRKSFSKVRIISQENSKSKDQAKSSKKLDPLKKKKQVEMLINGKLDKIEQLTMQKIDCIETKINQVINKNQIIDEQVGIMSRKLDKQKGKFNQISLAISRCQNKKFDQKIIQNLKNMVKKLSKDYEEGLEQKINKEVYEKEKIKLQDKFHFISEMLVEKAQKGEMKKIFAFLQQKIKDIIIVMTDEQNIDKDGAVKKTPFKCLSCDKDLEPKLNEGLFGKIKAGKENNSINIRCVTNQIRKRIRVTNNSIDPADDS